MIAVVVSLVAVVLLVLVVVALGMRSMNRRESALPAERLRELEEKEAQTPTLSIDDFATREPKMNHFSPDLTPFDEPKPPRQPRPASSRGKRGVNEFGVADDYDDDYWTRLQADEGGFGGSLAARMGASRPVPAEQGQSPAVDADAVTMQAPLPNRPQPPRPAQAPVPPPAPAVASASLPSGLADLVEPVQPNPAPTAAALAEQKTVTFAAPTPGAFGEGRPSRPRRGGSRASAQGNNTGNNTGNGGLSRPDPLSDPLAGPYPRGGAQAPARSSAPPAGTPGRGTTGGAPVSTPGAGPLAPMPPMGPTTSGGFPATPPGTGPVAAPYGTGGAAEPAKPISDNPWARATSPTSGGWEAANTADILDDPAPSYTSYQNPVFSAPSATSYEVSSGWATIDDDALTGPTPAISTPTSPSRAVSPHDDQARTAGRPTGGNGYDAAPSAWPEPAAGGGSGAAWPSYGDLYGTGPEVAATPDGQGRAGSRSSRHRAQDPDYPDYYR
ncbi:hypothetical protein [Streptosporangium carneum]|uniref:Uncharacterized protein n=1 Tax=Streptosporangium carneum TaxID=47481 RepID=A0A9W6IAM0_9ACTN|nr:hypothetical protein [Streptosporangium carneum]GLK14059.1 hypothetical protein GCM10017600_74710 [Streptosporangium carneum]